MPTRLIVTPCEKEIIDIIRRKGVVTRLDLDEITDHPNAKINSSINSLLKKEFIQVVGSASSTGGRRPRQYGLNGGYGCVAGVDIGATSIDIILADFSGKSFARYGEPSNVREGPKPILERVASLLNRMMRESGQDPKRLYGLGIGVPGPVDFALGITVSPPIMPGWDGYPIQQAMHAHFPYANILVDNDVNIMASGEMFFIPERRVDNLIFVKIGTGIGAGIICNGVIYRGSSGCAGDIGHICVDKNGPVCPCGNTGCLEAMAAGPAIAERGARAALEGKSPILLKYYKNNGDRLRTEDVGSAAAEGDPTAIEIIRDSGRMIGDALASLVNFFNPAMIIIGGGVSKIGNLLLSSIRQAVLSRSLPLSTRNLSIVFSTAASEAGVIGAMVLAIDNVFAVEKTGNGK